MAGSPLRCDKPRGILANKSNYINNLDGYVRPLNNGAIGTTTAAASTGDSDIYVSASCLAYLVAGHWVLFGTATTEYWISAIDLDTNKVTITETLEEDVANGAAVKMMIKTVNHQYIGDEPKTYFCTQVSDVKGMPETMELFIRYNHAGSGATASGTLYGNLVYRYG